MSAANESNFFRIVPDSVNHTILNALHMVRRDRIRFEQEGHDCMWSSIDHLIECASCGFVDVVNANTPIVQRHVHDAARYLYGVFDKRAEAIAAIGK